MSPLFHNFYFKGNIQKLTGQIFIHDYIGCTQKMWAVFITKQLQKCPAVVNLNTISALFNVNSFTLQTS